MNKRKLYKIILTLLLINFSVNFCLAMLPPDVCNQRIKDSKIQAIATVKDIKTVYESKTTNLVEKQVIFELEKSMGEITPKKEFSGYCDSVIEGKIPIPGGPYFRPVKNQKVFVTITKSNGYITSYTILTPELQEKIIHNFKKIKYDIDRIYYD